MWSFPTSDESREEEAQARAIRALHRLFDDRSRNLLRIEEIDAEPAARAPLAETFTLAGFRQSYKGLELERSGRIRD